MFRLTLRTCLFVAPKKSWIHIVVRRTHPYALFYAMITNIGRLRRKLVELDIDKDTILIFITDNGSIISGRKYNAGMPATKEANGTARRRGSVQRRTWG